MSAATTSTRLRTLTMGQRVKVVENENGIVLNAFGTVSRVCSNCAWVTLDERSKVESVHPFDADDARGKNVRVWPEGCEAATATRAAGNRKSRRANRIEAAKAAHDAAVPPATIATFGKDHWLTFAYIETRCVDYDGIPDRRHLRCIHGRHPLQAHEGGDASAYPTRLKSDAVIHNHDDWDCLDDLEREGLLTNLGSSTNPRFKLTARGQEVAAQLRAHKGDDGNFASFVPTE